MPEPGIDFRAVVQMLNDANVRYVLIGGVAMRLHGSSYITDDVDVSYARDPENYAALVQALSEHRPHLRGVPADRPFVLDVRTFRNTLNLTLETDLGDFDLLGEVAGVNPFEDLWTRSLVMDLDGLPARVASIDDLIAMKRAANRLKDRNHVLELEALRRLIENET